MEAYFQYQRVQQAVQQHLLELKNDCSCPSYTVGSPHNTKLVFAKLDQGCICLTYLHSCRLSIHHGTPGKPPPTNSTISGDLILVGWETQNDPLNPVNQSTSRKLFITVLVSLIALAVTAASAIDACGVREYSEYFQVSAVVGSLATGKTTSIFCYQPTFLPYQRGSKLKLLYFQKVSFSSVLRSVLSSQGLFLKPLAAMRYI